MGNTENEKLMKDALCAIETLKSRVRELESELDRLEGRTGGSTTKSRARGPLAYAIGSVLDAELAKQRASSGRTPGDAIARAGRRPRTEADRIASELFRPTD
jgi:hypothetical protein